MTPTELSQALRDVEIANEETNYAKFQSDCAIRDDAAKALESMTIECKDLEWHKRGNYWYAQGVKELYCAGMLHGYAGWRYGASEWFDRENVPSAQAAANEHNKQQFQNIIEEWRKG